MNTLERLQQTCLNLWDSLETMKPGTTEYEAISKRADDLSTRINNLMYEEVDSYHNGQVNPMPENYYYIGV